MKITLTADDFGWSTDTVRETIECLNKGVVTNASIMVGMSSTKDAIAFAANDPDHCYGVHLVLAGDGAERPVSNPNEIPDLVGSDGCLLPARVIRRRIMFHAVHRVQLQREMRAQLDFVAQRGVRISYVDSHKHIHKLPLVGQILSEVLGSFGVTRVRRVQNVFVKRPWKKPTFWLGWSLSRQINRNFHTTDLFYMPTRSDDNWDEQLLKRALGERSLEIGIHPGRADEWRKSEMLAASRFVARARAVHLIADWTSVVP